MNAYPIPGKTGEWYVRGSHVTYRRRQDFREAGGYYNGVSWELDDDALTKLGITRMIKVETESCHENPQTTFVPESVAIVGISVDIFCGMCDSHSYKKIVRIL